VERALLRGDQRSPRQLLQEPVVPGRQGGQVPLGVRAKAVELIELFEAEGVKRNLLCFVRFLHHQRSEPHLRHLSPTTGSRPTSPGASDGQPFPQPDPPRLQGVALRSGEGRARDSVGPRKSEVRVRPLCGQHGTAGGHKGKVAGSVPQSAGKCLLNAYPVLQKKLFKIYLLNISSF